MKPGTAFTITFDPSRPEPAKLKYFDVLNPLMQIESNAGKVPTEATSVFPMTLTFRKELAMLVPQLFMAFTVTLPGELPQFTVIADVFCPDVMVEPGGTVHTYVRLPTWETEYVIAVCKGVTVVGPEIVPGFPGNVVMYFF